MYLNIMSKWFKYPFKQQYVVLVKLFDITLIRCSQSPLSNVLYLRPFY